METRGFWRWIAALAVVATSSCAADAVPGSDSQPLEGFVAVNGTRLQYLDWGGRGRALILIHGLADDPHVFEDIAPAFTDRFHVIAYARRGSGSSNTEGPYDTPTLTEDLRGLMDALGIAQADLAGNSAGGNEVTAMAGRYPERVHRIVYLDAAYDGADPDVQLAITARPTIERPAGALASLAAFKAYEQATRYLGVKDLRRVEAYQRARVAIQADGTVVDRVSGETRKALYVAMLGDKPRDYTRVRCPALVIFAEHYYVPEAVEISRRGEIRAYEEIYWTAVQTKSADRIRREVATSEIVRVPGAHSNFLVISRDRVVSAMRAFL